MIVAPAAKNAASKNHPKDILRDLYRIVLIYLTSNVAFKNNKTFSDGWILNFKKIVNT